MKTKNGGFTLIELIAIIFITSALLVPLMSSLIGNIEINQRTQQRRNATSVADGIIYGLNRLNVQDFRDEIESSGTGYIIMDVNSCPTILTSTGDQLICDEILQSSWGSFTLDADNVEIYMFNYALTSSVYNTITDNRSDDGSGSPFEPEAAVYISNDEDITCDVINTPYSGVFGCTNVPTEDIPSLIRVVIWIDYYDDPDQHVVLTGLIYNED